MRPTVQHVVGLLENIVHDEYEAPLFRQVCQQLHRTYGSHLVKDNTALEASWTRLETQRTHLVDDLDELATAMERLCDRYGYEVAKVFRSDGGWYGETSVPSVDDDVAREHLRPHLESFAAQYLRSCTFMLRRGQRSQEVDRLEALPLSGRTPAQEEAHRRRLEARKRKREERTRADGARKEARRKAMDTIEALRRQHGLEGCEAHH